MDQFKGQPRLPKFAVPKRYDIRLKPDLIACRFAGSVAVDLDIVAATSFIVLNAAELSITTDAVSFTNRDSSKVLISQIVDYCWSTIYSSVLDPYMLLYECDSTRFRIHNYAVTASILYLTF